MTFEIAKMFTGISLNVFDHVDEKNYNGGLLCFA